MQYLKIFRVSFPELPIFLNMVHTPCFSECLVIFVNQLDITGKDDIMAIQLCGSAGGFCFLSRKLAWA